MTQAFEFQNIFKTPRKIVCIVGAAVVCLCHCLCICFCIPRHLKKSKKKNLHPRCGGGLGNSGCNPRTASDAKVQSRIRGGRSLFFHFHLFWTIAFMTFPKEIVRLRVEGVDGGRYTPGTAYIVRYWRLINIMVDWILLLILIMITFKPNVQLGRKNLLLWVHAGNAHRGHFEVMMVKMCWWLLQFL